MCSSSGCCCHRSPRRALLWAGLLTLLAFFSPGWIFSFQHTEGTVETTQIESLGLYYPVIKIVATLDGVQAGSQTYSKPYASDKSTLVCPPEIRIVTLDLCGLDPDDKEQALCKAQVKICGAQFKAATSFSFFQSNTALVASALTVKYPLVAKLLAVASTFSGLIAMACVADVNRLLQAGDFSGFQPPRGGGGDDDKPFGDHDNIPAAQYSERHAAALALAKPFMAQPPSPGTARNGTRPTVADDDDDNNTPGLKTTNVKPFPFIGFWLCLIGMVMTLRAACNIHRQPPHKEGALLGQQYGYTTAPLGQQQQQQHHFGAPQQQQQQQQGW
jgi:hypothetical protein